MICSNCTKANGTETVKIKNIYFVVCQSCALFFVNWMEQNKDRLVKGEPDDAA